MKLLLHLQLQHMLENIKHSIVLLQIAKNTAHPINGIYQGPKKLDSSADSLGIF